MRTKCEVTIFNRSKDIEESIFHKSPFLLAKFALRMRSIHVSRK